MNLYVPPSLLQRSPHVGTEKNLFVKMFCKLKTYKELKGLRFIGEFVEENRDKRHHIHRNLHLALIFYVIMDFILLTLSYW